jgi:hypothetical protein
MAKIYKSKNGKKIVLRNPAEKSKRFARQLKSGKVAETGKDLTDTDKAFRRGYLTSRSDNANAYNSGTVKLAKRYAEAHDGTYKESVSDGYRIVSVYADGETTSSRAGKIKPKRKFKKSAKSKALVVDYISDVNVDKK